MTDVILKAKRKIRRALQAPLYNAVLAAGYKLPGQEEPAIQWKGVPFSKEGLAVYFAAEIAIADVLVHEIGPNPMVEARGHVTINVHSPLDEAEDANDAAALAIAEAYPYGATPSFDGLSVNIDKIEPGVYGRDGVWMTSLVVVHWSVFKRGP